MIFVLSIIPSALFTAAYAYLFMYRGATIRGMVVQTALRFGLSVVCYIIVYLAAMLTAGAVFRAFDWSSEGETAFRLQFIGLSLFAGLSALFLATRRLGPGQV